MPTEKELEELIHSLTSDKMLQRKLQVYSLKKYSSLTLQEIGKRVGGLKYTTVSMTVRRLEDAAKQNNNINNLIKKLMLFVKCEDLTPHNPHTKAGTMALAHEVGHALGLLDKLFDKSNLMYKWGDGTILTARQSKVMLSSDFIWHQ